MVVFHSSLDIFFQEGSKILGISATYRESITLTKSASGPMFCLFMFQEET